AQRLDAQLERASTDMSALREGSSGQVVIGASGASASDTVPLAVLKLLEKIPQARVQLVENTVDELMEQLAQGKLDVVVGRSSAEYHDPMILHETLYMEPLHIVARPRHPLMLRTEVQWSDLMEYRWLL